MTQLLSGYAILETMKARARTLKGLHLSIILVGNDPASLLYVNKKKALCEEVGFDADLHHLPESSAEEDVCALIKNLNIDPNITGILVRLPLPTALHRQTILDAIAPPKDIDGLTSTSAGNLYVGLPGFVPCTPLGCLYLIHLWKKNLTGLKALVVGQSNLVGKPLSLLLLCQGCTVIMGHEHSRDLPEIAATCDIIVSAVGKPFLVGPKWIMPGACVVDVGINIHNGLLVGDVVFDLAQERAGAITPVPGGAGPATLAFLLYNLMKAFSLQHSLSFDHDVR